jgi:bacterioferritin (cytochrome b1)
VLERLVPSSEHTAELVQEISAASQEQSTGADQINRAIQQLDTVTQQNATTAEQISTTAETLTSRAEDLQQATAFFTVKEEEAEAIPPQDAIVREMMQTILKQQLAEIIHAVKTGGTVSVEELTENALSVKQKPKNETSDKGSDGADIQLEPGQGTPDEQDQEFEKY